MVITLFALFWTVKATKELFKLKNTVAQKAIKVGVSELANYPSCTNVKALTNHDYQYRLRVGNYRVFFNVHTDVEIVSIEEVKKRDERTY